MPCQLGLYENCVTYNLGYRYFLHNYISRVIRIVIEIKSDNKLLSLLQGPDEDEEPESELTVQEIKEKRIEDKKAEEEMKCKEEEEARLREEEKKKIQESAGCSWGFCKQ